MKNIINNKIIKNTYYKNNQIKLNYGFTINTKQTIKENVTRIILNMTPKQYFNKITKTSYHNLCTTIQPPQGAGNLLGLGLKFCIQTKKPSEEKLINGINRFKRDVRLAHFFAGTPNNPTYTTNKKSTLNQTSIHANLTST